MIHEIHLSFLWVMVLATFLLFSQSMTNGQTIKVTQKSNVTVLPRNNTGIIVEVDNLLRPNVSQEGTVLLLKQINATRSIDSFQRKPLRRFDDVRDRWLGNGPRPDVFRPPLIPPGIPPPPVDVVRDGHHPEFTGFVVPRDMIRVEDITADCQDNYMRITIRFNGSFTGLIYSTGYVHDLDCIYVNGTGRSLYEFYIRQNRCGTQGRRKEDFDPRTPVVRPRHNEYLLNTVTVQYSPIIEEEWDEHFRVTCEHGHDFWKTVTFPVINVEVNTGNPLIFALNPPKCYMEILLGWTITGRRISGPVTVGDPLTLVIYMRSENSGFDIVVSNCIAHNGQQNSIRLVDKEGCVINEKLLSPFRGQTSGDSGEEVTLFAYFKAFRFTGSPALYLECDIHMCHGTCPHQQCYWRSRIRRFLEKRESGNGNPLMSESVNLYQTLEVRQADETGTSNRQPNKGRLLDENAVCFRTAGFATMITILLTSVVLAVCISLTMCFRMRKMSKHNTTAPLGAKDNYVSKSKTSF